MSRWAWIDIDLDACAHNVAVLRDLVAPAQLWAVVKADGYGHGAAAIAAAALGAGAEGLAVALVQEGVALRAARIDAPIMVLSPQPAATIPAALANDLQLTVTSRDAVASIAAAGGRDHPVHLKVDTGMNRVGTAPADALAVAEAIAASPATRLHGVSTHLACADAADARSTVAQLDRFDEVLAALHSAGHRPAVVHAANSAGAIAHPRARHDLVRCGIAVYGSSPGEALDEACRTLRPVLSLRARVSWVHDVRAGDSVSYGWRHTFPAPTTIATVPLGYADGVPRRLWECGGAVLIGGRRRPIVGVVTMDQLMVDVGHAGQGDSADEVRIGDEVVLIGRQGDAEITATEWADRLGTISYEILCALGGRLARHTHRGSPNPS